MPHSQSHFQVSPEGSWLSYQSTEVAADGALISGPLVARSIAGDEVITLHDTQSAPVWHQWFPNGQRILIVPELSGRGRGAILVKDISSLQAEEVAEPPVDSLGFDRAAISPDGKRIAYGVIYDDSPAPVPRIAIEMLSIADGQRQRVVEPEHFIDHLFWTPDGSQVVYFKGRGGTPPSEGESYLANAIHAPDPPELVLPGVRLVAWSPTGKRALWQSEPMAMDDTVELFVSNWPDVTHVQSIAKRADPFGADWAGSDDAIVCTSGGALYVLGPAEQTTGEHLTLEGHNAASPRWVESYGIVYKRITLESVEAWLMPFADLP